MSPSPSLAAVAAVLSLAAVLASCSSTAPHHPHDFRSHLPIQLGPRDFAYQPNLRRMPRACLLGMEKCDAQNPTPPHTCLVANEHCPRDGKFIPVITPITPR
jgi:hypothetical protein